MRCFYTDIPIIELINCYIDNLIDQRTVVYSNYSYIKIPKHFFVLEKLYSLLEQKKTNAVKRKKIIFL